MSVISERILKLNTGESLAFYGTVCVRVTFGSIQCNGFHITANMGEYVLCSPPWQPTSLLSLDHVQSDNLPLRTAARVHLRIVHQPFDLQYTHKDVKNKSTKDNSRRKSTNDNNSFADTNVSRVKFSAPKPPDHVFSLADVDQMQLQGFFPVVDCSVHTTETRIIKTIENKKSLLSSSTLVSSLSSPSSPVFARLCVPAYWTQVLETHIIPSFSTENNGTITNLRDKYDKITDMPLVQPRRRCLLICGARNSGKSTFGKYVVNTLLNHHAQVAWLETDVGQPEFGCPGLVSLVLLTKQSPLLGPGELVNLYNTDVGTDNDTQRLNPLVLKSFYIGALSPSSCMTQYKTAVAALIHYYDEWSRSSPTIVPITTTANTENRFTIDDMICPLVVNTHGWMKGAGIDLLRDVVYTCRPHHIIQLSPALQAPIASSTDNSSKDKNDNKKTSASNNYSKKKEKKAVTTSNNMFSFLDDDNEFAVLTSDDDYDDGDNRDDDDGNIMFGGRFNNNNNHQEQTSKGPSNSITPASAQSDKSATSDYVLVASQGIAYSHEFCAFKVRMADDNTGDSIKTSDGKDGLERFKLNQYQNDENQKAKNESEVIESIVEYVENANEGNFHFCSLHTMPSAVHSSSVSVSAQRTRLLRYVGYFTHACTDIESDSISLFSIASRLLSQKPYKVSFSSVTTNLLFSSVPSGHVWFAFNGSLVGLCRQSTSLDNTSNPPSTKRRKLLCNYGESLNLSDCLGIGIVRGIDMEKQILYILTPLPFDTMKDVRVLTLGNIPLPGELSQTAMSASNTPYTQSSTSQTPILGPSSSAGTKSPKIAPLDAPMRSRGNLQRRKHSQRPNN